MDKKWRSYTRNSELEYGDFKLTMTTGGTVYWKSPQGHRKLETLWSRRTQTLSVSLPDGKEIQMIPGDKGPVIITKEPVKELTCLDCEYKKCTLGGGFCYMFKDHFKINEEAGPLTPCAKFKKGVNE